MVAFTLAIAQSILGRTSGNPAPKCREIPGGSQSTRFRRIEQSADHRVECQPMARAFDDGDRVVRADIAFFDDSQIRTHPHRGLKPAREIRVVHAHSKLVTGESRLCDLEKT